MSKKEPSVSERFAEIDAAEMERLGSRVVDQIMLDIRDRKLSLSQVASRNNTTTGTVVQVARFHKIDPVTLQKTE